MKTYKGYQYGCGNDGLWFVMIDEDSKFIVALDDSKSSGNRKIVEEANNEEGCIMFVDYLVSIRK